MTPRASCHPKPERGLSKKGRYRGRGGEGGYPKMVTNANGEIGGRRYVQMLTSPQYSFNIDIYSYFLLFSSHPLKLELNT